VIFEILPLSEFLALIFMSVLGILIVRI
jgi:hypothetical protein